MYNLRNTDGEHCVLDGMIAQLCGFFWQIWHKLLHSVSLYVLNRSMAAMRFLWNLKLLDAHNSLNVHGR